jgi:hypothetical protein
MNKNKLAKVISYAKAILLLIMLISLVILGFAIVRLY